VIVMGYLIAGSVLTSLGALALVVTVLALALPLAWLWMLIDAALREECDYPGGTPTSNNRLLWVLLILFVHFMAVPYFFIVYRPSRRGATPQVPVQTQTA
jgi:hypothetical protein